MTAAACIHATAYKILHSAFRCKKDGQAASVCHQPAPSSELPNEPSQLAITCSLDHNQGPQLCGQQAHQHHLRQLLPYWVPLADLLDQRQAQSPAQEQCRALRESNTYINAASQENEYILDVHVGSMQACTCWHRHAWLARRESQTTHLEERDDCGVNSCCRQPLSGQAKRGSSDLWHRAGSEPSARLADLAQSWKRTPI